MDTNKKLSLAATIIYGLCAAIWTVKSIISYSILSVVVALIWIIAFYFQLKAHSRRKRQ